MKDTEYLTVEQFAKKLDGKWPTTTGTIRSIIFDANRGKNKFQSAFIKMGRRILIDETQFWKCVKNLRNKKD